MCLTVSMLFCHVLVRQEEENVFLSICLYFATWPCSTEPLWCGWSTVPSSPSPVLNIRCLIHPVQCQQFKRVQFVFLSTSISVILLRAVRSHFSTRVPSKGLKRVGIQECNWTMTQYYGRIVKWNEMLKFYGLFCRKTVDNKSCPNMHSDLIWLIQTHLEVKMCHNFDIIWHKSTVELKGRDTNLKENCFFVWFYSFFHKTTKVHYKL